MAMLAPKTVLTVAFLSLLSASSYAQPISSYPGECLTADGASCQEKLHELFKAVATTPDFPRLKDKVLFRCFGGHNIINHGCGKKVGIDDVLVFALQTPAMLCLNDDSKQGDHEYFIRGHASELSFYKSKSKYTDDMIITQSRNREGVHGLRQYGDYVIAVDGWYDPNRRDFYGYGTSGDPIFCIAPITPIPSVIATNPILDMDVAGLIAILKDAHQQMTIRVSALEQLRQSGQLQRAVLPILDILASPDQDLELKNRLVRTLAPLKDERAMKVLIGLLSGVSVNDELKSIVILELAVPDAMAHQFATALFPLLQDVRQRTNVAVRLGQLGDHSAVLPLLSVLCDGFIGGCGGDLYNQFFNLQVIAALGNLGDASALQKLMDNHNVEITVGYSRDHRILKALEDAIQKIMLGQIRAGTSQEAIRWAQDLISFSDGSRRSRILDILKAFEETQARQSVRVEIARFLRKEIASGYHDYDQGPGQPLNGRMREVADRLDRH